MDDHRTIVLGGDGLVGTNLLGRFFLEKRLGEGGYGAVYLATQLSVKRSCAVKILSKTEDPKFLLRFESEARATSKLAHPNTVIIYDFGHDKDKAFIAMELLDGESLLEKLEYCHTLSVAEALHVVHQVGASLDDAHANNLIHRDVKPHNVMIVNRGNDPLFVKVIDFGLVKAIRGDEPIQSSFDRLTKTGAVVGTPAFMSPEQVGDLELDGRSDQYSLAVLLYRCLTGRTPFIGINPVDLAAKHLLDKPMLMRQYNTQLKVSLEFEAVVAKALSKDPTDRFNSCLDFVNALLAASSYGSIDEVGSEVTIKMDAGTIAASIEAKRLEKVRKTLELDVKTTEPELGFADTLAVPTPQPQKVEPAVQSMQASPPLAPANKKSHNLIYVVILVLICLSTLVCTYFFFAN